MCQLIEVTWFIWKLSADQLIVLLDREQYSVSYFWLVWEHRKTDNAHILNINVLINWQLSKEGTRSLVSLDRIAGSGVNPSRSSVFWKLSADKLLVFKWSQAQVQFFCKIYMKYVMFMCRTIKMLISNWFSNMLQHKTRKDGDTLFY